MKNYYISDLHLGHKNCIRFDERPFADIDEMASVIIRRWNSKVRDEDHVYLVGDVAYRHHNEIHTVLEELKGHIHLVIGNHDPVCVMKNGRAMNCFESVEWIMRIEDEGRTVCLCHFPIICWDQKHRNSYHIYGHVHSKVDEDTIYMMKQENAFNCGCMLNDYYPCTLEELAENKKERNKKLGIMTNATS